MSSNRSTGAVSVAGRRLAIGLAVALPLAGVTPEVRAGSTSGHTLQVRNKSNGTIYVAAYNNDDPRLYDFPSQDVRLGPHQTASLKCNTNGSCKIAAQLLISESQSSGVFELGKFSGCVEVDWANLEGVYRPFGSPC